MTNMRLKIDLRGLTLQYDAYTFGGIDWGFGQDLVNYMNNLIMFDARLTLNADAAINKEILVRVLTGVEAEQLLWTDKFIYPFFIKPMIIVDGVILGQLRYGMEVLELGGTSMELTYINIFLKKIDTNGNETTLGTTTIRPNRLIWTSQICIQYTTYPFFFYVSNKEIDMTKERILLVTEIYGRSNLAGGQDGRFLRMCDVNTTEQNVIIPIV